MTTKHNPIKAWMVLATTTEQEALAAKVGTSRAVLYQYASDYRGTSTERAISVEKATTAMNKSTQGRLPVIPRTALSEACRKCEFAKKCLGESK